MASSLSKRAATFAMGEAPLREWGAPMFTDETEKKVVPNCLSLWGDAELNQI